MISKFYTKLLKFIEHLNRWVENCKKERKESVLQECICNLQNCPLAYPGCNLCNKHNFPCPCPYAFSFNLFHKGKTYMLTLFSQLSDR